MQDTQNIKIEDGPDGTKLVTITKQDIALILHTDGEKYWINVVDPLGEKDAEGPIGYIRQMVYGAAALAADDPDTLYESAFIHAIKELRKSTGSTKSPDEPATDEERAAIRGENYSEEELKLLTTKIEGSA